VVWARCYEGYGAPAFWPWLEIIRHIAASNAPERLRRALGPGAADLAQIVPELGELFPELEPPQVGDPETARFRLFDSVDRFLVRVAAIAPLVLVVDDLQWADAPSLQLLRHLASRPDGAPMLILATYRDAELVASEPFAELLAALANQPGVRRIDLAGLAETALRELVAGAGGASETVVAALHHRTGGNPFYVSQLVAQLESGDRTEHVPGGVRDVIRHRLTRLPAHTDELLTVASVVGEEFDLQPLADVLQLEDERALELIEAAVVHRLVAESPRIVGGFRFAHALIRETLYGQLSAVRKARLHLRVGEALEQLHRDDADRLVEIADHFYKAAPAGAVERAYAYAVGAAEQATARLGYEQAEEHLRRARELLDEMTPGGAHAERELDLQLRLGGLLMMTRGYAAPEVGEACARAAELCRTGEVGNEQQLAGSMWRLGVYYEVRGDFATSRQTGEQLLELGSRSEDARVLQLGGRQLISVAAIEMGDPATAREHLIEVRGLADELGDGPAEAYGMDFRVTSRAFLGWATSQLGHGDEGSRLSAEALTLARQLGRSHDEAFALFVDALCGVLRRDAIVAGNRAEEGAALCAACGFRLFGAMVTMIAGWAVALNGAPDAGVARIGDGLVAFEATGAGMMLHFFLGLLAEAQLRAGQPERALASVERAVRALDTSGRFYEAELRRLEGELALALEPDRHPQ
jgi:predicted ATPase